MIIPFRRQTRYHIAFSIAEQGIACLSSLFASRGFDVSAAEIRDGRSLRECTFFCLPVLSLELGIQLQTIDFSNDQMLERLSSPTIVFLHRYGVVILERSSRDEVWMNNPSKGWSKMSKAAIYPLMASHDGFSLVNVSHQEMPLRRKPSFLAVLLLADRRFLWLAILIIFVSILHGFSSLLDPVLKNMYFTNVVQMSMIDWARPIAISYFFAAVFTGTLLIFISVLCVFLTCRMALNWSFSVFSSMLRLPAEYLRIRAAGDLMSRIRSSEALGSFIGSQELLLIGSFVNLFVFIWVLFSISPSLSVLLISFQLLGLTVVYISNSGHKERSDKLHFHSAAETSSFINLFENIDALRSLKRDLFGLRFHLMKVSRRIRAQQDLSIYNKVVGYFASCIDLIQSITMLTFASLLIIDGEVSLGQYIGFSAMLSLVISPIDRLARFISSWQTMQTVHERVLDVCEESSLAASRSLKPTENGDYMSWTVINGFGQQSSSLTPQSIRLSSQSNKKVLKVDNVKSMNQVEHLLSGDDVLPSCYEVRVLHRDGIKKFLVARSKPHIYNLSFIDNISLYADHYLTDSNQTIADVIDQLELGLSVASPYEELKGYSQKELHRFGILRTLWHKPHVMVITSCDADSASEEHDFHLLLSQFCASCGINLILLTSRNDVDQSQWGKQVILEPLMQPMAQSTDL